MLANQAQACTPIQLLPPASCANTAAATSSAWIDISAYTGDLVVIQNVGAVTGSITGKLQHADDNSGTNAADVTGAAFAAVSSSTSIKKLVVKVDSLKPFIKYVGTIVTGPVLVGVDALCHPQRSEEHTSELQSPKDLVCRLL